MQARTAISIKVSPARMLQQSANRVFTQKGLRRLSEPRKAAQQSANRVLTLKGLRHLDAWNCLAPCTVLSGANLRGGNRSWPVRNLTWIQVATENRSRSFLKRRHGASGTGRAHQAAHPAAHTVDWRALADDLTCNMTLDPSLRCANSSDPSTPPASAVLPPLCHWAQ